MPDPAEALAAWTIVVAAGGGTRFGRRKHDLELAGRRVLSWSVEAARSVSQGVVVVVPPDELDPAPPPAAGTAHRVVSGGATRSASVRAGLGAVPAGVDIVLVHDAARPAATPQLFARVVDAVRAGATGVVPGVAVTDTLRHRAGGAVDRTPLVAVQTPQGFVAEALRAAHAGDVDATDDATIVEAAGGSIEIVEGETTNTKLTYPADRFALEHTLSARSVP